MVTVPAPRRALFLATVLLGMLFFVWIGAEDSSTQYVAALGGALAVLFIAHALVRQIGGQQLSARRWLLAAGLSGLLAGAGAALATATLMAIKVSVHGHPDALDFAPQDVLSALLATPVDALIGLLGGVGLGLVYLAARK